MTLRKLTPVTPPFGGADGAAAPDWRNGGASVSLGEGSLRKPPAGRRAHQANGDDDELPRSSWSGERDG